MDALIPSFSGIVQPPEPVLAERWPAGPAFLEPLIELPASKVDLRYFHDQLSNLAHQFSYRINQLAAEGIGIDRHQDDRFSHILLEGFEPVVVPHHHR